MKATLPLLALVALAGLAPAASAVCAGDAVCASVEHQWLDRQLCAQVDVSLAGVEHHNTACTSDFLCPWWGHICWYPEDPLPSADPEAIREALLKDLDVPPL